MDFNNQLVSTAGIYLIVSRGDVRLHHLAASLYL
jgi:hypothetical protein